MKKVDLHVHSVRSDGSCHPAELAKLAQKCGLSGFALTDHDIIDGNKEAAMAAAKYGVEFINGMEMTAEFRGRKIHIICLGFDPQHPSFQLLYQRIRSIKEGRIPEMIAYIKAQGIDISLDKVRPFALGGALDRYAIMRYLVSLQLYDRAQPLWNHYLDPATAALGLNINPAAEEALPRIHEAGGVTSLAHFHKNIGLKGMTRQEQEAAIIQLHSWGLDGMERYYPNYTADDEAFAERMIEKHHLLATGGTDFHGTNRPGVELGTGIGQNISIPYDFMVNIRTRVSKK